MRAPSFVNIAGVMVACAGAVPAGADPTVIRDARIGDLGITPTLGRGYAPAGNTFQSVCFDTLPTTAASFDFDYSFEHVETDDRSLAKLDRRYRDAEVGAFVRSTTRQTSVVRKSSPRYLHYVLAALTVDSYYSSIDEGKAKLGEAALKLLRSGAVLDFFVGCGTHYVRSISRRSYFLSMFSYTSAKRERDGAFELELEESLRRLDIAGTQSKADLSRQASLSEQASEHDLRIVTKSIGLRAETTTTLIPFDLPSYKDTLKQAFKASQDDMVGRITAMEIVPWAANPVFLATIDLSEQRTAGGAQLTRFERKQLLEGNAEFYVALSGVAQEDQDRVNRALVCKQELEQHILVNGAIPQELASAQLVNHRTGEHAPLAILVDAVSEAKLAALEAAQRAFAYGPDGSGGAAQCIAELDRGGLTTRAHRAIPACEAASHQLVRGGASVVVEDYCLPELVR